MPSQVERRSFNVHRAPRHLRDESRVGRLRGRGKGIAALGASALALTVALALPSRHEEPIPLPEAPMPTVPVTVVDKGKLMILANRADIGRPDTVILSPLSPERVKALDKAGFDANNAQMEVREGNPSPTKEGDTSNDSVLVKIYFRGEEFLTDPSNIISSSTSSSSPANS